jgi:hypothetical protein
MNETKKNSLIGNLLKYVIPLIISIGLCYLLFTGIDFKEMMEIIRRECDFRWIGLTLLISIFSHIFRAMRWNIQLRALDIKSSLFALTLSIFGTYAVNLVFPRLGEVWRTGYIAQRERAPFTTVFGSMVADRLADTVTVLLLTIVTFLLASKAIVAFVSENAESYLGIVNTLTSPWLWLAIVAVGALLWWFLTRKTSNKFVQKIQSTLKELWVGFSAILTMPGKGKWLILTFCIWGCYFMQLYVAFYAFPFTRDILAQYGALAALVAFVLSSISMGVPSNGGIGPWQWAIIFALNIYGLDKASGGAFANLVLGMQTLLLIVLGIFTFIAIAFDKKRATRRVQQ